VKDLNTTAAASSFFKLFKEIKPISLWLLLPLIVVLAVTGTKYLIVFPAVFLFFALYLQFKERFIPIWIITTFLTVTSTFSVELRLVVQITNLSLLSLVFLHNYGFDLRSYPGIPRFLSVFLVLLISAMIASGLVNSAASIALAQVFRLIIFLVLLYLLYAVVLKHNAVFSVLLGLFVSAIVYFLVAFSELAKANFDFIQRAQNEVFRIGSDYVNANGLGAVFGVTLILALSLYHSKFFKTQLSKVLLIGFIVTVVSGLLVANSRSALLATLIGLTYYFFITNRKIVWYGLTTVIIALLVILIVEPLRNFFELFLRFDQFSTGRDFLWANAWEIIKHNPFFGTGPGAYKLQMYKHLPYALGGFEESYIRRQYEFVTFGVAHNFYLFMQSELGLIGGILSVYLPASLLHYANKVSKQIRDTNQQMHRLVVGITAVFIFIFIRGIFESSFILNYGYILSDLPLWSLIALLIVIEKRSVATNASS